MIINNVWHIEPVSADEYQKLVDPKIKCIYNSAKFNRINEYKVDRVWYLIAYKGASPRFAAVMGEKAKKLYCPYSAPFSYPEPLKKETELCDYSIVYKLAKEFFLNKGITGFSIYLPPDFYDCNTITAWINVFLLNNNKIEYCDINHALIGIDDMVINYDSFLSSKARNKFKLAWKCGTEFLECKTIED
jgi:hypothetical protein